MNWQEVCIETTDAAVELLSAQLLNLGINGWVEENPTEIRKFMAQKEKDWDYLPDDIEEQSKGAARLTFYVAENQQGQETILALRQVLQQLQQMDTEQQWGSLTFTVNHRKQEEWEDNWKQYYKPFPVGKGLLIKPSWEDCIDVVERKILEIDPGSSFGTGQHHTTKLCLELAEEILQKEDAVLDIGCGTGILSIGAMLLGAKRAVAVDIEEHSAHCAQENAQKNGIAAEQYQSYCGNILTEESLAQKIGDGYDVVLANIVADVIMAMAPLFWRFLRPGGHLICSGIIAERAQEVQQTLQQLGFAVQRQAGVAGWVAILLQKKEAVK